MPTENPVQPARADLSGLSDLDFSWHAHPARDRPGHAAAAGLVVLALGAGSALFGGSPWWGIGAVAMLGLALNRFFLPSRFELDDEGITARYPLRQQRLRWSDLRRFVHDERGGYLSTRLRPSRMDAFSGMHVVFGPDRDDAIRRIRAMVRGADDPGATT